MRDDFGELSLERRLVERANAHKVPIGGTLELLPLCNMDCEMCYVRLNPGEMEKQGRLRSAKEWLELGEQMQKAGVLFLTLTGGEPLLYTDFRPVYEGLLRMGMIVTINTNGTLITEEWTRYFAAHPPRRINITLYGSNAEVYDSLCHYRDGYEKALSGIRLLKNAGIAVKVNGSLVRTNSQDQERIPAIARELEAAVHVDTYMLPAVRERERDFCREVRLSPEEAAKARVQLKKAELESEAFDRYVREILDTVAATEPGKEEPYQVFCRAGLSSFAVNWQGMLQPCIMLDRCQIPVFEVGFEEAFRQAAAYMQQLYLSSKCSVCKLRKVCETCGACALYETGSYEGVPEYMCAYIQKMVECLQEEWERK